jgi:Dna[CI] antecedent, DciA
VGQAPLKAEQKLKTSKRRSDASSWKQLTAPPANAQRTRRSVFTRRRRWPVRDSQQGETEVIEAWSKIVGEFIAAHSAPMALREGVLYVRVLQPALHYELEQISKTEILRKLKQRFVGKTIRDVRFRLG